MSNKIIAETLGIDFVPESEGDEVEVSLEDDVSPDSENDETSENDDHGELVEVVSPAQQLVGDMPDVGHVQQDYEFTRQKMRSFLLAGEEGLKDLMALVKEEPQARGFEVVATMLNTVTDMATKFFDLQKKNRELHMGSGMVDGQKPGINIRNGAVFVGDSVSMLDELKARKKAATQKDEEDE